MESYTHFSGSLVVFGQDGLPEFLPLLDDRTTLLVEARAQAKSLVEFAIRMLRKFMYNEQVISLLGVLFGDGYDVERIISNLTIMAEPDAWSWAISQDIAKRNDPTLGNEQVYPGPGRLVHFYQDRLEFGVPTFAWTNHDTGMLHFWHPLPEQYKNWGRLLQHIDPTNMQAGESLDNCVQSFPFLIMRLMAHLTFDAEEMTSTVQGTYLLAYSRHHIQNYQNSSAYAILAMLLYHTARWPEFHFNRPSCQLERVTQIYEPTRRVGPLGVVAKLFDTELRAHGLYVCSTWEQKHYDYMRLIKFPTIPTRSPLYPVIFLFAPGTNIRDVYRAENGNDGGLKRKRLAGNENNDDMKRRRHAGNDYGDGMNRQRCVGNENDDAMNRNVPSSQTGFPQVRRIQDVWGPMGPPNPGLWS